MMNLTMLLAEGEQTNAGGFAASWPILLVLVLFLALMVWNMFSGKRRQNESEKMLNELKVGDKVVTNAGIYGEIVSIRHTNFGKVALIKSGEDKKASYISVNLSVILGIDEKQDVVVDSEGNIVEPKEEETKVEEVETKEAEVSTEAQVEEKKEEKKAPAKKSTTKKTTAKKTESKKAE